MDPDARSSSSRINKLEMNHFLSRVAPQRTNDNEWLTITDATTTDSGSSSPSDSSSSFSSSASRFSKKKYNSNDNTNEITTTTTTEGRSARSKKTNHSSFYSSSSLSSGDESQYATTSKPSNAYAYPSSNSAFSSGRTGASFFDEEFPAEYYAASTSQPMDSVSCSSSSSDSDTVRTSSYSAIDLSQSDTNGASEAAGTGTIAVSSLQAPTTHSQMIVAWISLCIGILCMSAIGPTFVYVTQMGVTPLMAVTWRCECMLIFVWVPALIEFFRASKEERRKWVATKPGDIHVLWYVYGNGLSWGTSLLLWVVSLQYTTTVRSSLFGGCFPMIVAIYLRFKGEKISIGEYVGVFVSIFGIASVLIVSVMLNTNESRVGNISTMWVGDALAFATSFIQALQVVMAVHARASMPVFAYTFLTTLFLVVNLFVAVCIINSVDFHSWTLSHDLEFGLGLNGLMGWAEPSRVGLMLLFGFVVGMVVIVGLNVAVKYIPPVLYSVSQLVDPVWTGVIAWFWDLEEAPTFATLVGGLILCSGIVITVIYDYKRHKQEERAKSANLLSSSLSTSDSSSSDEGNSSSAPQPPSVELQASRSSGKGGIADDDDDSLSTGSANDHLVCTGTGASFATLQSSSSTTSTSASSSTSTTISSSGRNAQQQQQARGKKLAQQTAPHDADEDDSSLMPEMEQVKKDTVKPKASKFRRSRPQDNDNDETDSARSETKDTVVDEDTHSGKMRGGGLKSFAQRFKRPIAKAPSSSEDSPSTATTTPKNRFAKPSSSLQDDDDSSSASSSSTSKFAKRAIKKVIPEEEEAAADQSSSSSATSLNVKRQSHKPLPSSGGASARFARRTTDVDNNNDQKVTRTRATSRAKRTGSRA
eukprot:TRINITY_DN3221_c0_g1_i1.p1 TRINITY_DN3221_c0_g1~~TRINITY_DN3221_c0_g1_i1.p1  ORF type:complete len:872 (+),score=233.45 TRINITY_DN3221_c0_g1_i1:109-2724(+)